MSDDKFGIPESLEKALIAKEVVPFVGAGVSMAVKKSPLTPLKDNEGKERKDKLGNVKYESLFSSWWEFLSHAADKLDREKIALNSEGKSQKAITIRTLLNDPPIDYLDIAQRAFDALGNSYWYDLLKDEFEKDIDSADEDSKKLAKLIWEFGNSLIVTTNIDLVLQSLYEKPGKVKILDTQEPEYAELQKDWRPKRPTVLHLHGHIDNESNIVFTKEQYKAFYDLDKNRAKLETLQSLFRQRTILFIGFSLDDLHILRELERVNLVYKGGANRFFALIREDEKNNPNIPSYIKQINFPEFGKPLEDLVEELTRIAKENDTESGEEVDNHNPISDRSNEKDRLRNHFNVPFASKGDAFVGRDGLREKIWESLNQNGRAAIGQAVAIEGFGGLGKTQLAVEYAHAYRDKYDNGVFWLTADEDMSVQLIRIGEELSWISPSDKGFDQAELVRNRFRKLSDCLIVFDNVDNQEAIKDYLPETDAHPHILVTSREVQNGFNPIYLDTLSTDESRELLIKIADRSPKSEQEEKALANILQELDGLPLAVELVGGYLLRRKSITFQTYYEHLEKESIERIEERFPNNPFTKRDKSIIRALTISEKLLNETEYLEDILDILAWSGKSSMGYSLLREMVGTDDDLALQDAIGVALELHFIKQEENEERYTIHRLLARVRQFEKPLKERKDWHQKIAKSLENWFRNKDEESKTLSEAEIELDHLEIWQRQTLEYIPAGAVWLTVLKAEPLFERGSYREAQKYIEEAFELYEKENLTDKLLLVNLYDSISRPSGYLGNYKEAQNFIEKALDLYDDNLIDDKKLLADLLANLGSTYSALGNHQKALELQQQVLEMRQELFGEKHSYVATSLANLGLTYSDLGNHQKALKLQQQALGIEQEFFGEKHPSIATSLGNLGVTYSYLENHQKALKLQQQALGMQEEVFGEKHPDIANSLANLGATHSYLGNHQKALELQQQALGIEQELFGEKHPNIAISLSNLGSFYDELGNHQKSLELKQQAFEMRQELFGEKHPDIANSLNNLGFTYEKLKDRQKAIEFYKTALDMRRELLGEKHPLTILTCSNLIRALNAVGKPEQAGRLAAEFLAYVPQNHPNRKFFEETARKVKKPKKRHKKGRH